MPLIPFSCPSIFQSDSYSFHLVRIEVVRTNSWEEIKCEENEKKRTRIEKNKKNKSRLQVKKRQENITRTVQEIIIKINPFFFYWYCKILYRISENSCIELTLALMGKKSRTHSGTCQVHVLGPDKNQNLGYMGPEN